MDHTRVPARRVRGDVDLLLEDRDPSLVPIREPICDRRPEDPAAHDRDVPGFHGPDSRNRPEFIIPVYLRRGRRDLPFDVDPDRADRRVERDLRVNTASLELGMRTQPKAEVVLYDAVVEHAR